MKISFRRLLSVVLTLCLFAALLSVGVWADDPIEIKAELGTALSYTVEQDGTATGFELVSGTLPSGVNPALSGGKVKLGERRDLLKRLQLLRFGGHAGQTELFEFSGVREGMKPRGRNDRFQPETFGQVGTGLNLPRERVGAGPFPAQNAQRFP